MIIERKLNHQFYPVVSHVKNTAKILDCSGAGVIVIYKNKIVSEEYWGKQSKAPEARPIQKDSQFHVASVRKSYIGFAVAYAVHHSYIESIDDGVTKYLSDPYTELLDNTTIRHLLTHTHGLNTKEGRMIREFPPGQSWAYRDIGIELLVQIVKLSTGKTIAQILREQVFKQLDFKETGWYDEDNEKLVKVIREPNNKFWSTSKGTDGDKKNMYVSTRELAYWGYIHLKGGFINGRQVVSKDIIKLATSLQTPNLLNKDLPQNGFLWFVKDLPALNTEIGESVPKNSFQILGYTSVAVLVIPMHDIVVVRMFNSYGSTPGYDYLSDIREFGNTVMKCM
ncbi:serine hydrolase domain-containing protein [Bacillus sp. PS06]|uniref:serine hydrolase domain-containing protein n=1 Tax=Bacillus sp. PS06 TaxID=2764176 RepID=UPI0017877AD6|nr:serine hydrolase domain-containing protein [Bacillus sp. PS06]MBD8070021.1 beta-lactamase family protein [Bacillus sp. PS06]